MPKLMPRRLLVSAALPYANGPIHIGHLLEYVQADTWVRFMRMVGHETHFICADDSHGTPVMLEAEKQGVQPEALVERMRQAHLDDFTGFAVAFDNYYTTHSEENKELSERVYHALQANELIDRREVVQLYDPVREQFLADRYIRGSCPACNAPDQTGDNCEVCSAVYAATDLGDPRSALSGVEVEKRSSEHYFFKLSAKDKFLREWLDFNEMPNGSCERFQPQVRNKLYEWIESGLKDWDISRDAPYFGFLIPGTQDKYFYVWLDAPIGYLASFKNLTARTGIDFEEFLAVDTATEMYHFIGKDIINFHGLFWPAILHGAGMRTPTRLFVHGFLTVNAAKMSKSKGTFITASSYLAQGIDPDYFRYYIMSKLNENVEDVDLSMDDFVVRVNTDLVNKLANIPSRVAKLLARKYDNCLDATPGFTDFPWDDLARAYEHRRFSEAGRIVMRAAEEINRALEEAEPWKLAKDSTQDERLHQVCSAAIQKFRQLAYALAPIVPGFAERALAYCGEEVLPSWAELASPLPAGHTLGKFKHLLTRLQGKQLDALIEANRKLATPTITIDDFGKIELRVAEIIEAVRVVGADRLARLRVSLGELGERTIFAGILGDEFTSLPGRKIVVVANLAPRKMRFGVSEGMAIGTPGPDGQHHFLFADADAHVGAQVS